MQLIAAVDSGNSVFLASESKCGLVSVETSETSEFRMQSVY